MSQLLIKDHLKQPDLINKFCRVGKRPYRLPTRFATQLPMQGGMNVGLENG